MARYERENEGRLRLIKGALINLLNINALIYDTDEYMQPIEKFVDDFLLGNESWMWNSELNEITFTTENHSPKEPNPDCLMSFDKSRKYLEEHE